MTFHYLATPYSLFPGGLNAAFVAAIEQTTVLVRAGVTVFSPIVHCHPLAVHDARIGTDFVDWEKYNKAMLDEAASLILCKLPSWETSFGMGKEKEYANALEKPIHEMLPGLIPDALNPDLGRIRNESNDGPVALGQTPKEECGHPMFRRWTKPKIRQGGAGPEEYGSFSWCRACESYLD